MTRSVARFVAAPDAVYAELPGLIPSSALVWAWRQAELAAEAYFPAGLVRAAQPVERFQAPVAPPAAEREAAAVPSLLFAFCRIRLARLTKSLKE